MDLIVKIKPDSVAKNRLGCEVQRYISLKNAAFYSLMHLWPPASIFEGHLLDTANRAHGTIAAFRTQQWDAVLTHSFIRR